MKRYHHFRLGSIIAATTLFGAFGLRLSYAQANLDERLAAIEEQAMKGEDLEKLEAEALKLIQDFDSPRDKGKVYACLTCLYAERGAMKQPEKVIGYAAKALEYPLDLRDSVRVHLKWGRATWAKYLAIGPSEYLRHRREIVVPSLSGLKLLLDNAVPEQPVSLPGVGRIDYDGPKSDPIYQQMLRERERQIDACKRAEALNELVQLRFMLTHDIVDLYSAGGEGMEELRTLSSQILKDDAVVATLLARVKANRAQKREGRAFPCPASKATPGYPTNAPHRLDNHRISREIFSYGLPMVKVSRPRFIVSPGIGF